MAPLHAEILKINLDYIELRSSPNSTCFVSGIVKMFAVKQGSLVSFLLGRPINSQFVKPALLFRIKWSCDLWSIFLIVFVVYVMVSTRMNGERQRMFLGLILKFSIVLIISVPRYHVVRSRAGDSSSSQIFSTLTPGGRDIWVSFVQVVFPPEGKCRAKQLRAQNWEPWSCVQISSSSACKTRRATYLRYYCCCRCSVCGILNTLGSHDETSRVFIMSGELALVVERQ